MKFPGFTRYLTGILVPVSALRSQRSLGAGEFADLPALAHWCAEVGVDLIQLLPVNDTGWQASPYSALSAFALHPLYIRIEDLPEVDRLPPATRTSVLERIASVRRDHDARPRITYGALLDAKQDLLWSIYETMADDRALRDATRGFADGNPWVGEYAAYKTLKRRYGGVSWKEWPDHRDPTTVMLGTLWAQRENERELLFHAWVQMRLDEQFRASAAAVNEYGVMLKGDLPILINEDSVDTWAHREQFSTWLRAGSPPDGQNPTGQNWGLPIYDWPELARSDYSWWKDRLRHAARYYAAYRLDHVLGFFRAWSIPADDFSGYLGHFVPCAAASRERLHDTGMDDGRIRWLAEPHIPGYEMRDALGDQTERVVKLALHPIDDQDLFVFAPTIRGERDIVALECSEHAREWLLREYRNRALIRLEHDTFVPAWTYRDCSRYQALSPDERSRFDELAAGLGGESEKLWEEQGRRLLGFMRDTTSMLPCAEDLGAIPACVPGALADLRILGLRIPRWARVWHEPGQPYIPPTEYPFLTVCAPSVHDTSTLRGWWEEEENRYPFWKAIGLPGDPPSVYDEDTARTVLPALLETSSALCVLQIQDVLALVSGLVPDDPREERVNTPGTMSETNWSYRMGVTLEDLAANAELIAVFGPMTADRRRRQMTHG